MAVTIYGSGQLPVKVSQSTLTSRVTTTSATYSDVGLSASITPFSANSKILVMVNLGGTGAQSSAGVLGVKLLRGSTTLITGDVLGSAAQTTFGVGGFGDGNSNNGSQTFCYLDSPATTSSTTYKIQFASTYNSLSVSINGSIGSAGSYNLATAATITLIEVSYS
jgi:hypothetical protein